MKADVTYTRACLHRGVPDERHVAGSPLRSGWSWTKPENERDPSPPVRRGLVINPDFKVKCHETLLTCVLDGDVPAFKTALD
jgi:hypothetical protein